MNYYVLGYKTPYNYNINNTFVDKGYSALDLGIIFDCKFLFDKHIETCKYKSL